MGNVVKKIVKPITSIFEAPKKPKAPTIIQAPAAAPSRSAAEVQKEAAATVSALRRGRGRASTIIAALDGELPAGAVQRKQLLGG